MSLNFGKESGSLSGSNPHIGLPAILDCETCLDWGRGQEVGGGYNSQGVGTTAKQPQAEPQAGRPFQDKPNINIQGYSKE